MADEYNGWANRETWAFLLHIDNDQSLYDMSREYVGSAVAHEIPGYRTDTAADALKTWAETLFTRAGYVAEFGDSWPDGLADTAEDIGSLWRVDWHEAAQSIMEDLDITDLDDDLDDVTA